MLTLPCTIFWSVGGRVIHLRSSCSPILQMSVENAPKTRTILNSAITLGIAEVPDMKIRWKIDLAISGAFLVGLGLAGAGAYTILTKNALEHSLQDARIMIEGASAIRIYTAESVRPLLEP